MNNSVKSFKNIISMYILDNDKYLNDAEIDELVDTMRVNFGTLYKLEDIEIEEIKKQIKFECSIKMMEGASVKEKHKEWFLDRKADLDMKYWNRYRTYLINKGFSVNVVNKMDDILDKLTDYLGDPCAEQEFQRRGLVIGDVQSGKTSNYTGLICKAADAKYRVIVLLTGTIEKLRRQTQGRIDEGFVGMKSIKRIKNDEKDALVGVGKIDKSVSPIVLTTTESDFKTTTATSVKMNIESTNNTFLFVIKKNVTTLRQLNKWLKDYNLNGKDKINASLLMVDDESDNASVNTAKPENNPTAINAQIREMLNIFTKASYVGFTATPFANIFIDPDIDGNMEKEDIFPKDYIYSLDAPSNYIGARDIFGENSKYRYMIKKLDEQELEESISLKMKKDDTVIKIPESMKDAINNFLVGNVIRDLRNQTKTHRSMMINVSRFTNIQLQIEQIVKNYVKEIQESVRLYGKLKDEEAFKDININRLYNMYLNEFSDKGYTWDEVKKQLLKAIEPIKVVSVNSLKKNSLEYEDDKIRVIAIGGFSLSRGLTLEGLMTSYVYGNTRMYDTLMQKGRWFGYRTCYEDLCSVWMTEESIEWYENISDATDELRISIKRMEEEGARPIDFGLMVRCDVDSLEITARNKMRTAKEFTRNVSLSEEVIETPKIRNDIDINNNNKKAIDILIKNLGQRITLDSETNKIGIKEVEKNNIIEFLENYEVSNLNYQFNSKAIVEFLKNYQGPELEKWDIAFISGSSKKQIDEYGEKINYVKRSFELENEGKLIRISGKRNRLGSQTDTTYGLSKEQIKEQEDKILKEDKKILKNKDKLSEKDYFRKIKRNPLLLIYFIELNKKQNENNEERIEVEKKYDCVPLTGIGLAIPTLENEVTKYAKYKINLIAQENGINDSFYYDEDDEEGDE